MEKIRKILAIILFIMMFIFMALAFVSCNDEAYRETQVQEDKETGEVTYTVRGVKFHVVEIDGCEYLMGRQNNGNGSTGYMSHKGNCKYCEERRRAEQY